MSSSLTSILDSYETVKGMGQDKSVLGIRNFALEEMVLTLYIDFSGVEGSDFRPTVKQLSEILEMSIGHDKLGKMVRANVVVQLQFVRDHAEL